MGDDKTVDQSECEVITTRDLSEALSASMDVDVDPSVAMDTIDEHAKVDFSDSMERYSISLFTPPYHSFHPALQ